MLNDILSLRFVHTRLQQEKNDYISIDKAFILCSSELPISFLSRVHAHHFVLPGLNKCCKLRCSPCYAFAPKVLEEYTVHHHNYSAINICKIMLRCLLTLKATYKTSKHCRNQLANLQIFYIYICTQLEQQTRLTNILIYSL